MVYIDKKNYHTVCPHNTYFKADACYNEPVNEARLMVFPIWNSTANALNWMLTVDHSSLIDTEISEQLLIEWTSSDAAIQSELENNKMSQLITSD
jgi:hypothetical protein